MAKADRQPLYRYWQPRFWPTWLGIALLRVSCFLPYRWQIGFGKAIGRLGHRIGAERRAISRRNIELCFPELSASERDRIALEHFESLGASLMEFALGRWASIEKLRKLTTIVGLEHVRQAMDAGHNVILLSAHFTTTEISGRVMRENAPPYDAIYRAFRNPLLTELVVSGREKSARRVIEKNDIKRMVRSLREGTMVWYAPDQAYHLKQSELLPFFGVPSMTNVATTSLAKLGKAVAIPYFPRRLPEGGYEVTILPPVEGLPSDDPAEDTRKFIAVLEDQIRKCPEQYYWVHRRFKNRPEPLPDAYADLDSLK
jgi:KDO2-lipid IV(A) lauroyltransferase